MYSLVTAVLLSREPNSTWEEMDIALVSVYDFQTKFVSGFVVLEHTSLAGEHIVDYQTFLRHKLPQPSPTLTFERWLTSFPNIILPTIKEPVFSSGSITYSDAYKAGWRSKRAHPVAPDNDNYTDAQLVDSLLTKPNFSYSDFGNQVLVSVNGHLHLAFPTANGIKVRDASKTFMHSGRYEVGLIGTSEIGNTKQIPITEDNLIATTEDDNFEREFLVDLEEELYGKTVWISIGGYLLTDNDYIRIINAEKGLIYVDISKFDIARRITDSMESIDLSSLGIERKDFSPNLVDISKLKTPEVVQKYLTLSQSFIIVVDSNLTVTTMEDIGKTSILSQYIYHKPAPLLLVDQYGLIRNYQPILTRDNTMTMLVPTVYKDYRLYDTTQWRGEKLYGTDFRQPYGQNEQYLQALHVTGYTMTSS